MVFLKSFNESRHKFKSNSVSNWLKVDFCVCAREREREREREKVREIETPTHSHQGLVVVDVFSGKGGTHADGERWQRQTRKQASQQELQMDLLLV